MEGATRAGEAGGPSAVTGASLDAGQQNHADEALRARLRQQAAVADLGQKGLEGMPLDELFRAAVDALSEGLHAEYAKVLELLPDGDSLLLRSGVGWREGYVGSATEPAGADSQAGFTLLCREPVVVEDLASETRFGPPPLLLEHGVVSGISGAIQGRDRPFGVLAAHARRPRSFAPDDVNFLKAIANVLAAAVERKRAEDDLRRAHEESEARVQQRTATLMAANRQLEHEIAERRRVEHERSAQQQTLRAILDNAPMGIWMLAADGRLRFVNDTFCSWFGIPESWLLETGAYHGLFDEPTAARWATSDVVCMQHESPSHCREAVVFADGRSHGLEVIRVRLPGPEGQSLGMVGLALDITERERAEQDAREHQAALARVARLSTMGQMATNIAHEVNQPLSAIANYASGCVRRLEQGEGGTDDMLHALRRIAAQAERAGQVIRRTRSFLEKHESQRALVDVNKLVREVAEFIAPEVRQQCVSLRLDLADSPPQVLADGIQIEQVLLNLARNAIEAMRDEPRELTVETRAVGQGVQVTVADTGCGLPGGAEARLFEPFFTTKPGGMGMGLSISNSIIEAHEGRLWTAENPQRGTSVHFTLPVSGDADAGPF